MVGPAHVLTGDGAVGYAVDWTGGFTGHAPAVLRPRRLPRSPPSRLCADAGVAVVPQGGTPGWSEAASRCAAEWCSAWPGWTG